LKKITALTVLSLAVLIAQSDIPSNIEFNLAEFTSNRELMYLVELPEDYDSTKSYPLVVGLQGYSGRPEHLEGKASFLIPEGAIGVYPQGLFGQDNHEERSLGYCWFHLGGSREEHFEFSDNSVRWIMQCIRTVMGDYPVDTSKIFLYGFSQGGIMSYTIGLAYPELFRGVIPGGAVLDAVVDSLYPLDSAVYDLSIQAFHGVHDRIISLEKGQRAVNTMDSLGIDATLLTYPVGHTVIPAMQEDARDFCYRQLYEGEVPLLEDLIYTKESMTSAEHAELLDKVLVVNEPVAEIADKLLALFEVRGSPEIKEKVVYLLGAARCSGTESFLIDIVNNRDNSQSLRQAAHNALAKLGTDEAWASYEGIRYQVVVAEVAPESQAEELGLQPGDVILSYNGVELEYERELRHAKSQVPRDADEVEMVIERDGKKRKLKLAPGSIGVHLTEEIR